MRAEGGETRLSEDLRLPKPPGFIRSYFNRFPWVLDSLIAAGYVVPMGAVSLVAFVASLFGASPFTDDPIRSTPVWGLLMLYTTAAVTVGLLFRRHVPFVTATICAAAMLVSAPVTNQIDAVPMMFALYALAVYRSARAAWLWTLIASAVGIASTVLSDPFDLASIVGYGLLMTMLMTIATLVGITFGNRRRYIQALLDRAQQLARERDQQAQLAAAAERARIAREMHDIVAHSLTVIVALSDGAEASIERSPETAKEAVRQTGITARRALTDVRRSLGVLTEPDGRGGGAAPIAPQPGLADLPELIASFRAAGLPVRFTTSGEPPADLPLQVTVFRVVQEALTNALRYAVQVTAVDVVLRYVGTPGGGSAVSIEVTDDGVDPGRGASSAGSGRGLIGMRERVAVYGGTVSAGPAGSRGWRVNATLPSTPHDPGGPR
ncbi:histidine kinase [Herbiconiux sp. CPCC 203407]|uniref:histidine kinase n=1 Tax=Herbiconiux oxytropis TaxID=2970915 RepID=A0AA41XF55_9MICO|nr:histidine kinase [Herbiconiux oxytropis]MCS5722288.1 histidine kinase [Herbiconiux oxytropis]MCS5727074.1 histidine kinase [Herbiconiux oxytropis]